MEYSSHNVGPTRERTRPGMTPSRGIWRLGDCDSPKHRLDLAEADLGAVSHWACASASLVSVQEAPRADRGQPAPAVGRRANPRRCEDLVPPVHRQAVMLNQPAVLIVDDDLGIRETASRVLGRAGFHVWTAGSGAEGIAIARSRSFDLMLVDFRLPDMLGTDVVRLLRNEVTDMPFVLVSAFLTTPVTVEAMKLGALDVVEKPLMLDDLLAVVHSAVRDVRARRVSTLRSSIQPGAKPISDTPAAQVAAALARPRSAAERWAVYVFKACKSEGDLKTLEDWATFVGVSYSSLCESCRLVGVRPHDARDLARVLRAAIKSRLHRCRPEVLLDVSDRRTLENLLERAGLNPASGADSVSVGQFLECQRFVASDNEGLSVLRKLLNSG